MPISELTPVLPLTVALYFSLYNYSGASRHTHFLEFLKISRDRRSFGKM